MNPTLCRMPDKDPETEEVTLWELIKGLFRRRP